MISIVSLRLANHDLFTLLIYLEFKFSCFVWFMHSLPPPLIACSSRHLFGEESYSKDVCFVCFVSLLPFCSCLFVRMRGRNLLLKHDECHHLSISMLILCEQNFHEITPLSFCRFWIQLIVITFMCA